jgi:hypothetical protein
MALDEVDSPLKPPEELLNASDLYTLLLPPTHLYPHPMQLRMPAAVRSFIGLCFLCLVHMRWVPLPVLLPSPCLALKQTSGCS